MRSLFFFCVTVSTFFIRSLFFLDLPSPVIFVRNPPEFWSDFFSTKAQSDIYSFFESELF